MTPDEMLSEIYRIQQERNPDGDPGDIYIDTQDDMALTLVIQPSTQSLARPYLGVGGSIQEALESALENVKAGN